MREKFEEALPMLSASQWRRHGVDWGGHVHRTFARGRPMPEIDANPMTFREPRGEGKWGQV